MLINMLLDKIILNFVSLRPSTFRKFVYEFWIIMNHTDATYVPKDKAMKHYLIVVYTEISIVPYSCAHTYLQFKTFLLIR